MRGKRFGGCCQFRADGVIFKDFKNGFGAQHKHPQAFDRCFKQILRHNQQQIVSTVDDNHIGDDAAFGRVVSRVTRLPGLKIIDVVGKLSVQEGLAVFAADARHAEKGQ